MLKFRSTNLDNILDEIQKYFKNSFKNVRFNIIKEASKPQNRIDITKEELEVTIEIKVKKVRK